MENSDGLNIASNLLKGYLGSYTQGYQREQDEQKAAARAAALKEIKDRELGLQEKEHMLQGPEAAAILGRLGMRWDPTKPLPVSALGSLSAAYYRPLASAGAQGKNAAKMHADIPGWKQKATQEAMRSLSLDPKLPIPADQREDVIKLANENMQSYLDSFNAERQDAGLSPIPYQPPDVPLADQTPWWAKAGRSFMGAVMGKEDAATAPAPAPAAKKPAKPGAPPPLPAAGGWTVEEE